MPSNTLLPSYGEYFYQGLKPDPLLTVSAWADQYRMLSSVASGEPRLVRQLEKVLKTTVEPRIRKQSQGAGAGAQVGELAVIDAEAEALIAALRRDSAYAGVQNSFGAILVTIGADPVPDSVSDQKLPTLAKAIGETLRAWQDGSAFEKVRTQAQAPQPPEPAAAKSPALAQAPVTTPAPIKPTGFKFGFGTLTPPDPTAGG
ncbi:hypothetical protein WCLP8_2670001 [uncultured Gammaproteobacteria bacterium]